MSYIPKYEYNLIVYGMNAMTIQADYFEVDGYFLVFVRDGIQILRLLRCRRAFENAILLRHTIIGVLFTNKKGYIEYEIDPDSKILIMSYYEGEDNNG